MVVASPITGAAIIGGELIISLPNGQIINCGLVQGPPGLKANLAHLAQQESRDWTAIRCCMAKASLHWILAVMVISIG